MATDFIIDKTTHATRTNFWTPQQILNMGGPRRTMANVCVHVLHTTMGHIGSDIPTLTLPGGQNGNSVSCHWYVPRMPTDGKPVIFQIVDPANAAWQAFTSTAADLPGAFRKFLDSNNENYLSVGTEMEALPNEPLTAFQHDAIEWLQAYIWTTLPGILRDRNHVIGHYELSSWKQDPQRGIPGQGWDWDRFMTNSLALYAGETVPPVHETSHFFAETGHGVGGAFLDFYTRFGGIAGGIQLFGYPRSEETSSRVGPWSGTVQMFQRARFEWHVENGPPGVVMLGNIGDELMAMPH